MDYMDLAVRERPLNLITDVVHLEKKVIQLVLFGTIYFQYIFTQCNTSLQNTSVRKADCCSAFNLQKTP